MLNNIDDMDNEQIEQDIKDITRNVISSQETEEKAIIKDKKQEKVLACPHCRRKLLKKVNYSPTYMRWKCYVCHKEFHTPFVRSKGYFADIIGWQRKKVPKKDENGIIVRDDNGKIIYEDNKKAIKRKRKRTFSELDLMTKEEFLDKLEKKYYTDPYRTNYKMVRNCAFISFLYLTGARVEEVLGVRLRDEEGKPIKGKYIIEPIRKYQITKVKYSKKGIVLWVVDNMPVLKRRGESLRDDNDVEIERKVFRRKVAIPIDYDKQLIKYVDMWLAKLKEDDIVFPFVSSHGWRLVYLFNGTYNHFLRHMRASDLVNRFGFNSTQLQHFFGWKSSAVADRYSHLSVNNLVDSMIIGQENRGEIIDNNSMEKDKKDKHENANMEQV